MTPTTRAGKALLFGLDRLLPEKHEDAVERIAAIEAEARAEGAATERARIVRIVTEDVSVALHVPPAALRLRLRGCGGSRSRRYRGRVQVSRDNVTVWTCDRCGAQKNTTGSDQPKWLGLAFGAPPDSVMTDWPRKHLCKDCDHDFAVFLRRIERGTVAEGESK